MIVITLALYFITLLIQRTASQLIDLDHSIKGDMVWLEFPRKLPYPFDKKVKDLPNTTPNLFSTSHGFKTTLSLPNDCYLSSSIRLRNGLVFVSHLCPLDPRTPPTDNVATNQIIITHVVNLEFKSREFKRVTTSIVGKCHDMKQY